MSSLDRQIRVSLLPLSWGCSSVCVMCRARPPAGTEPDFLLLQRWLLDRSTSPYTSDEHSVLTLARALANKPGQKVFNECVDAIIVFLMKM